LTFGRFLEKKFGRFLEKKFGRFLEKNSPNAKNIAPMAKLRQNPVTLKRIILILETHEQVENTNNNKLHIFLVYIETEVKSSFFLISSL
jgi:hypothetical protein